MTPEQWRQTEDLYHRALELEQSQRAAFLRDACAGDRSPDGKRLSATSGNSVWMIDPETGERRLAIQFPQNFRVLFRAAWTPDGKSVIVNRQERVSHIVLLENF